VRCVVCVFELYFEFRCNIAKACGVFVGFSVTVVVAAAALINMCVWLIVLGSTCDILFSF